jgi:tetratricopeptide (TPR) repeat protein
MPLSGLSIGAVGDAVVVRDGATQRQVESGQYLLLFEGDPRSGSLSVIEKKAAPKLDPVPDDADDWFDQGLDLEQRDPAAAIKAYQRAIAANPKLLDAHVNLGRLLHEARRFAEAEKAYRRGMEACGGDALLLYNLGVLLDDLGRRPEAIAAYQSALRADPELADCHYNLALLCEKAGQSREAIRHMSQYRRLTATTAR